LARNQIYIDDEAPVLIDAIAKQISMEDTYLTAETLRLITGIDPGYSMEYVKNLFGKG
jgi:hypothetical protein